MLRFILKRFLEAIPVLFIVATLTFFLLHQMKGGPFDTERPMPPEVKKAIYAYYGLDKPVWQQYVNYMERLVFHGDLGMDQKYFGWSVNELLAVPKPAAENRFETHSIYADLQYLVSGAELMQTARIKELTPLTDYDAKGDYRFFKFLEQTTDLIVQAGNSQFFIPTRLPSGQRVLTKVIMDWSKNWFLKSKLIKVK